MTTASGRHRHRVHDDAPAAPAWCVPALQFALPGTTASRQPRQQRPPSRPPAGGAARTQARARAATRTASLHRGGGGCCAAAIKTTAIAPWRTRALDEHASSSSFVLARAPRHFVPRWHAAPATTAAPRRHAGVRSVRAASPISRNVLGAVRERVDIVEVMEPHVDLRRAGRNLVCSCPFHDDRTPSCAVDEGRGTYKCFGCGASGDSIRFVMQLKGITFPAAVTELAEMYGVPISAPSSPTLTRRRCDETVEGEGKAAEVEEERECDEKEDGQGKGDESKNTNGAGAARDDASSAAVDHRYRRRRRRQHPQSGAAAAMSVHDGKHANDDDDDDDDDDGDANSGARMAKRIQEAQARRTRILRVIELAHHFFRRYLLDARAGRAARDYLVNERGITRATCDVFDVGYAPDAWRALLTHLCVEHRVDPEDAVLAGLAKHNGRRARRGARTTTGTAAAAAAHSGSGSDSSERSIAQYYDMFRNRVMVPIRDTRGTVIAFGGRTLPPASSHAPDEHGGRSESTAHTKSPLPSSATPAQQQGQAHTQEAEPARQRGRQAETPKYLNSPETEVFHKTETLFGLDVVRAQRGPPPRSIVIVEGYLDVIALYQSGVRCAVASLGTAVSSAHLFSAARLAADKRVVLQLDNDDAGVRAAERAVTEHAKHLHGIELAVAELPDDVKDADEYVKRYANDYADDADAEDLDDDDDDDERDGEKRQAKREQWQPQQRQQEQHHPYVRDIVDNAELWLRWRISRRIARMMRSKRSDALASCLREVSATLTAALSQGGAGCGAAGLQRGEMGVLAHEVAERMCVGRRPSTMTRVEEELTRAVSDGMAQVGRSRARRTIASGGRASLDRRVHPSNDDARGDDGSVQGNGTGDDNDSSGAGAGVDGYGGARRAANDRFRAGVSNGTRDDTRNGNGDAGSGGDGGGGGNRTYFASNAMEQLRRSTWNSPRSPSPSSSSSSSSMPNASEQLAKVLSTRQRAELQLLRLVVHASVSHRQRWRDVIAESRVRVRETHVRRVLEYLLDLDCLDVNELERDRQRDGTVEVGTAQGDDEGGYRDYGETSGRDAGSDVKEFAARDELHDTVRVERLRRRGSVCSVVGAPTVLCKLYADNILSVDDVLDDHELCGTTPSLMSLSPSSRLLSSGSGYNATATDYDGALPSPSFSSSSSSSSSASSEPPLRIPADVFREEIDATLIGFVSKDAKAGEKRGGVEHAALDLAGVEIVIDNEHVDAHEALYGRASDTSDVDTNTHPDLARPIAALPAVLAYLRRNELEREYERLQAAWVRATQRVIAAASTARAREREGDDDDGDDDERCSGERLRLAAHGYGAPLTAPTVHGDARTLKLVLGDANRTGIQSPAATADDTTDDNEDGNDTGAQSMWNAAATAAAISGGANFARGAAANGQHLVTAPARGASAVGADSSAARDTDAGRDGRAAYRDAVRRQQFFEAQMRVARQALKDIDAARVRHVAS